MLSFTRGRYEIKDTLGEGGMGIVYRAYDPPPMDRDVALKTLPALPDPLALELFYQECRVLKGISHPNVVEIFDMGVCDEAGRRHPFFVMPLLQGQTLEVIIRDASHGLTVARVVEIMAQACRGLQAAHDHALVHRDVKPSNLFVLRDDSVKIIDFGVAHAVDLRSRSQGVGKGTLLYMAPEQVQHKPVSAQSDIFSLGVVCYEALTRRQPFRRSTEEDVVRAIVEWIPPPASDLNPAVSQAISRVVHKAMAKRPWNRFDTAREFGDTLQKALRNEPIELFDPSRIQPRLQRAVKALEGGDFQFAGEIVGELEAEGVIDAGLTLLRARVDQVTRQRTIAQLLDSARARFEEDEDPLALQKIEEILRLDASHAAALGLREKITARRSERQVDQWVKLARQHLDNRAFGPARAAAENVLALRRSDTRAAQLLKQIDADEQEYLKLRQDKASIYQDALNAWKNGEVSRALSRMEQVLALDRRAPDSASGERGDTYEVVYNKVRSEHDAMQAAYAEARRLSGDRDYGKALAVCETFLTQYPGHALFHALRLDIEEEQRQQLSAFIADVDRRLDAEPDLDAKVHLLREAVARYPDEPHFRRPLKATEDKRDLVNSIVARARVHEEQGDIGQALGDFDTLQAIYSPYPGLRGEQQRLQRRLAQLAADADRIARVGEIERLLAVGDHQRADERLDQLEPAFPDAPEWPVLRQRIARIRADALQADRLFTEGQTLCASGAFEAGVAAMQRALELDNRSDIRHTLCDVVIDRAEDCLRDDVAQAVELAERVCGWNERHTRARSILAEARARSGERAQPQASSVTVSEGTIAPGDHQDADAAETVFVPREAGAEPLPVTQPPQPTQPQTTVTSSVATSGSRARWQWPRIPHPRVAALAAAVIVLCAGVAMAGRALDRANRREVPPPPVRTIGHDIPLPAEAVLTTLRIFSPDAEGREVWVDQKPAGTIQGGSFARDVLPGEHLIELVTGQAGKKEPRTVISLIAGRSGLPRVGALSAPEQRLVVIATHPGSLRIQSSAPNLELAVDGVARGAVGTEGMDVAPLESGVHELTLGSRDDVRKVSVAIGPTATLDIMMFSDRNVGSLLLLTGEENVSVLLNGRTYHARTRRGELRIANLPAATHTISVVKPGFKPSEPRRVTIVKGQEATVRFALTPVERLTALQIDQATPDADVTIDGIVVGRVGPDGMLSYSGVVPGVHIVALNKAGHEPWQTSRMFPADQPLVLRDVTLPLITLASSPLVPRPSSAPTLAVPVISGLELLDLPESWSQRDGWTIGKGGGFVLSRQPVPVGRVTFALKQSRGRIPFSNGPRVNIVVGYIDPRNHVLLSFDEKYYYRTDVVNGKSRQLSRVAYRVADKAEAFDLDIELGAGSLTVRVSDGAQQWSTLDHWTPVDRPQAGGQIGFFVPGQDEVRLKNFRFEMRR